MKNNKALRSAAKNIESIATVFIILGGLASLILFFAGFAESGIYLLYGLLSAIFTAGAFFFIGAKAAYYRVIADMAEQNEAACNSKVAASEQN